MAAARRAARPPFTGQDDDRNVELNPTNRPAARAPKVADVETARPSTARAVFWMIIGIVCVGVAVVSWGNGALITPQAITHQIYQVGWFVVASIWALAAIVAFKM